MNPPLHGIHVPATRPRQRGMSLIELMIGLFLGLLVIGVALGVLMASRSVSGTVSDASQLQQQASHLFRVMGRQLRQAGSLRLLLASQKDPTQPVDILDPVALEAQAQDFVPASDTIRGLDTPGTNEFKLTVGYSNYTEPLHLAGGAASLQRNCLGQASSSTLIQSHFALDASGNTLRCAGVAAGSGRQPIAENVADFQVRYLLQTPNGANGADLQFVNAADVEANWPRVHGAEVCLVLFGTEVTDMPDDSTYTDCNGTATKMSTLPAPRTRRLHMLFRSMYQLRGQGMAG
ncbi:PilW family protein [Delftia lacustris]|uniref:PilW family protein n=1 Tax=Delftia lacustris TaxID=558537 RepID=UPI0035A69365